jgi:APA family basic amino acid/polyamine antiporter
LYVFANVSYLYVLSPEAVGNVSQASSVATEVVREFLGPAAVAFVAVAMMVSTLGSLHTGTMAGARISYAMSRDGLFFAPLARVSRTSRVPVNALILQGFWSCALALSGSYDTLTDYVIFAAWIFYALNVASVFILRRQLPDAERPYRTVGYPLVPLVFIVAAGWLIVNTLTATPRQALTGLAIILVGLPVYWYWTRVNGSRPDLEPRAISR